MNKKGLYLIGSYHQDIDEIPRLEHILEKTRPKLIAIEMNSDREITLDSTQKTFYAFKKFYFNLENKQHEFEDTFIKDEEIFKEKQAQAFDKIGLLLNKKQLATLTIISLLKEYITGYELYVVREYSKHNPSTKIEYIDIPVADKNYIGFAKGYQSEQDTRIKAEKHNSNNKESQNELDLLNQNINDSLKPTREEIQSYYANIEKINEIFKAARKEINKFDDNTYLKTIFNPEREKYMTLKIQELYENTHSANMNVIIGIGHFLSLKKALKHLKPKAFTLADYEKI